MDNYHLIKPNPAVVGSPPDGIDFLRSGNSIQPSHIHLAEQLRKGKENDKLWPLLKLHPTLVSKIASKPVRD